MAAAARLIRLRYAASCVRCGDELPRGTRAAWDRAAKTATCEPCLAPGGVAVAQPRVVVIDRGEAGASAARRWRRLHDRREAQMLARHKRLGRVLLALTSDPSSTTAWAKGADGERTIGRSLDRLREEGIAVLHDRRIPGSRANIDHLVVSQNGVFVVDPKNYEGRVRQRDVGGWFNSDLRLYVGGRDRTSLVHGMKRQVDAVRDALSPHEEWRTVRITPALVFVSHDNWSLFDFRPLRFGDVYVLWGKALGKLIRGDGPGKGIDVGRLERVLATALPPA